MLLAAVIVLSAHVGQVQPSPGERVRPSPAERLERAERAQTELEYRSAAEELMAVISDERATDDELFEANLRAGVVHRIMGNDVQARLHFLYVLKQRPETRLSGDQSPKVTAFFELVRLELQQTQSKELGPEPEGTADSSEVPAVAEGADRAPPAGSPTESSPTLPQAPTQTEAPVAPAESAGGGLPWSWVAFGGAGFAALVGVVSLLPLAIGAVPLVQFGTAFSEAEQLQSEPPSMDNLFAARDAFDRQLDAQFAFATWGVWLCLAGASLVVLSLVATVGGVGAGVATLVIE